MIPICQIEAYERLRIEIVRSAVTDLEDAMRKSDRLGVVCDEQIQMERWFLSDWGQLLSGDNGEYIIEKCRKSHKPTVSKKGRQRFSDEVQKRICEEYKNGARYNDILQRYGISSTVLYNIVRRWGK